MSKRSGILLCYPFEEKRLKKWSPPYIVQPKLDGERCRALHHPGLGWQLLSSERNIFTTVPHINFALENSLVPHHLELDGELYRHGLEFEEIHSRVSTIRKSLHPQFNEIQFHVFDVVKLNLPQWERLRRLSELSERFRPGLVKVVTKAAEDLDGVLRIYDEFISQGYEGIIVRHIDGPYVRRRSTFVMKFKPKKSDEYRIVGVKQMVDKDGNPKEMLGALICKAQDTDEQFSVGSGMDDSFRTENWPLEKALELVGKSALVEYQHITSGKGVPRFPVLVSITESEEPQFFNPLI